MPAISATCVRTLHNWERKRNFSLTDAAPQKRWGQCTMICAYLNDASNEPFGWIDSVTVMESHSSSMAASKARLMLASMHISPDGIPKITVGI